MCAEHKGYVREHRSFNRIWKKGDSTEPDFLGKILDKDNLNRAFKRVKVNKGAPGVDGRTIDETLISLREHNHEIVDRIKAGHYTPSPVRRVELPKPDGGVRKLGIPCIRYADDIVLMAKNERVVKRLLETSTKYLEGALKLKVNQEKSRVVSVFAIKNFKFLGFAMGRNGDLCPDSSKDMEEG